MAIGIDVTISPDGAVSGGRVAETSLDKVGKAADGAQSKISSLEREIAVLTVEQEKGARAARQFASTYSISGRATDAQRVRIEQLTGEMYDLQESLASTRTGMNGFSSSGMNVANIGYQIQDSMVQAQMGTSGFVIAAQQLPQALIGFGAIGSVIGTAVSIVAVGLMALNPSLTETQTTADKLTDTMKDLQMVLDSTGNGALRLSDDFVKLYESSDKLAKVQLSLAFSKAKLAIDQASTAALEATNNFGTFFTDLGAGAVNLEELDKRTMGLFGRLATTLEDVQNAGTFVGQGQIVSSIELLSDKFNIADKDAISLLRSYQKLVREQSPANLKELSDIVSDISIGTKDASTDFREFAVNIGQFAQKADSANDIVQFIEKSLKDLDATVTTTRNTTGSFTDTIVNMSNQMLVLQERLGGNERGAAQLAAVQRLGSEATKEQKEQVKLLAGQLFDLNTQLTGVKDTQKTISSDESYLQSLQQQVELVGLSARQQAVLRAEYALSADATDEQIRKARELAEALYDQQQAQRAPDTSDAEFGSMVTGQSRAIALAEENESIFEQLENQRQMILLFQEEGIGDAQAHADALVAIDKKVMRERVNITSSGLGSLLSLTQGFAGESSGIYQTLLAAQKTATLYSVLLSSQDAIGKAFASAPFPANIPAVAATVVETGALQAAVEAINPTGFATGGYVFGPGTGTSDSINARLSTGEFVMPADATRRYAPELNSMRSGSYSRDEGGGMVKVNIINQTTGRVDSSSTEWVSRDELNVILREDVPGIVADEINNEYSDVNGALQSSYVMQRNL